MFLQLFKFKLTWVDDCFTRRATYDIKRENNPTCVMSVSICVASSPTKYMWLSPANKTLKEKLINQSQKKVSFHINIVTTFFAILVSENGMGQYGKNVCYLPIRRTPLILLSSVMFLQWWRKLVKQLKPIETNTYQKKPKTKTNKQALVCL